MKKNEVLEIRFVSVSDLLERVKIAVKTKISDIQPKNVIQFDAVDGFRTFATSQKIELLSVLATERPKSIYELAKILNRTFSAVWKDCVSLKTMGFIKLNKSKDSRGSLRPELIFPYKTIKVFLPRGSYQIQFSKAGLLGAKTLLCKIIAVP
jgi:predicted transcriptional regulator